jgi:hypothetical protein
VPKSSTFNATLIVSSIAGLDLDVGVLCFTFGAALAFVDPPAGRAGVAKIDWGTVVRSPRRRARSRRS